MTFGGPGNSIKTVDKLDQMGGVLEIDIPQ